MVTASSPGGLAGRVVLVTGASRGIGRAIALGVAGAGSDVVVSYHQRADAAQAVVEEIRRLGRRAIAIPANVAEEDDARRLVEETVRSFGRLDGVVNNAGGHRRTPFLEITAAEFDCLIAVNLRGPFLVGQAAARHMVEHGGGRIVNVASIASNYAIAGLVHYQAAKAGVAMLTRGMALELARFGITVNAVAPGLVETDLTASNLADPSVRARRTAHIPLGRLGRPEDIVGAVLYLLSDAAAWTTGSLLVVDGGQTIQQ